MTATTSKSFILASPVRRARALAESGLKGRMWLLRVRTVHEDQTAAEHRVNDSRWLPITSEQQQQQKQKQQIREIQKVRGLGSSGTSPLMQESPLSQAASCPGGSLSKAALVGAMTVS